MPDAAPAPVRLDPDLLLPTVVRVVRDDAPTADAGTLTMRLRRRPDDGEQRAAEVLEYRQFADVSARSSYLRATQAEGAPATAFDVAGIVVPPGARQLLIEAGQLIQVVRITTEAHRLADVARFNLEETRSYFQRFAGFVGTALHVGPAGASDPDQLLEVVVWRSEAEFGAATSTDHFRDHVSANSGLAREMTIGRYDLV